MLHEWRPVAGSVRVCDLRFGYIELLHFVERKVNAISAVVGFDILKEIDQLKTAANIVRVSEMIVTGISKQGRPTGLAERRQ